MIFNPTPLEGAFLIDVERHEDERGFLARTFCEQEFAEHGPHGLQRGRNEASLERLDSYCRWAGEPGDPPSA